MKEINIQKVEQVDDVMEATIAVMDGTTEAFGRKIKARSASELNATLANLYTEVNKIPDEIAKVTLGKWTPPAPPPVVETPAPTAEEIKAQEIASAEMELEMMVEKAKKEKELAAIALENADVKAKLDELNALKK